MITNYDLDDLNEEYQPMVSTLAYRIQALQVDWLHYHFKMQSFEDYLKRKDPW